MKPTVTRIVACTALFALCLVWITSKSAAEPISGGDAGAAPATAPQSPELNEAMTKFTGGDFASALKALKEAVKKNRDLPPAQVIMFTWFAKSGLQGQARKALELAVADVPTDPEAYVIMGNAAVREGRFTEGDMLLRKASDLMARFDKSPKRRDILQPQIYRDLASISQARGDWAGAQAQLEAWLKVDPRSSEALQKIARCRFQQKDAEGALQKLKEAAKIDAEVLTPEAIMAQLYEQSGDHLNAKRYMKMALDAKPNDIKTHLYAGQWALETGQLKEAQDEAKKALEMDPKSLDAKILSGVIALFQKNYGDAEKFFEAAHTQSPGSFAASNNLALALIEQADEAKRDRAEQYAQNNMQQYGRDARVAAEAASTYGWVAYKRGKLDEAQKAFEAAISGGAVSADTAYYIAKLSLDRSREPQAKQWLEIALKSAGPFMMRQEAQAMADKLNKK